MQKCMGRTSGACDAITSCCRNATEELTLKKEEVYRLHLAYDERREKQHFIHQAIKNSRGYKKIDWENSAFCTKCWCLLHGVPLSSFYEVKKQMKAGTRLSFRRKQKLRLPDMKTLQANAYVVFQKSNFGDFLPHKCKVRLPYPSWPSLFEYYVLHTLLHDYVCVSKSNFKLVLGQPEHKDLSFKYGKGDFTLCDICYDLDKLQETIKQSRTFLPSDLESYKKRRDAHHDIINWDRVQYAINCNLAMNSPRRYMSICIDAMDQFKTNLPYFHRFSKKLDKVERIKNRLVGAIVHGRKPAKFLFHVFDNISSDANLVLTILMNLLKRFEGELPPTLFLQLDNCPGENKNRFVFSSLVLLIDLGLFKTIYVNFLMVGHTHIDIDRYFSYLSEEMKASAVKQKKPVCSMEYFTELAMRAWQTKTQQKEYASGTAEEVEQRYDTKNPPVFEHLDRTFDFKGLVKPHIKTNWSGHSKPRHFKIEKDATEDHASIQYRLTMHNQYGKEYAPEKGLNPFNSTPDLTKLRYASTRNRLPLDAYAKTIDLLQEEKHLSQAEHAEWKELFEGTEVHNCTECNELTKKHYDKHVSTQPKKGGRRTQAQLKALKIMKAKLESHMATHECVPAESLPAKLFEGKIEGEAESEDGKEEDDPTIVLKQPQGQVFTIGQQKAAFSDDIRIDDLVIVSMEEGKKGVAKAKRLDGQNKIVVHWFGNPKQDLNKKIYPCWKCTYSRDNTVEYSYGQKPTAASMKRNKYSSEPFEQALDPDSIIAGPVKLTVQGIVRKAHLK